jgi:SNF2 family DNA or RNA helicase
MPSELWTIDDAILAAFTRALAGPPAEPAWAALRERAETLALVPGFDRLITIDSNAVEELPHQLRVAQQVLRAPMGGRAILADEVGLGKTIEAGIILSELAARGLARRVLSLVPASLATQWQEEMLNKFLHQFAIPEDEAGWDGATRVIVSHQRAIREPTRRFLLKQRWDLVIVDEAHKVKNEKTQVFRLLTELDRTYCLLLTATPLQNNLRELYNLVTLIRPGQLGTWREFKKEYVKSGNPREPKNPEALRHLSADVMVRTRRASVADVINLPPRRPVHPRIVLTDEERGLYQDTVSFVRRLHHDGFHSPSAEEAREDVKRKKRRVGRGLEVLRQIQLCQRLCSSSPALAHSLRTLAQGELVLPPYRKEALELSQRAESVATHTKLDALTRRLVEVPDRIVVFSEHLPTIALVAKRVAEAGRRAIRFDGSLSRADRANRLKQFREDERSVLVSTRAGTEGLNLQFCNQLVNYELPWNPMVIEQRIGRVHRIKQTRETFIVNFAAERTIEAHVLRLLDQKIKLFELVVGELDVILGQFGEAETLETELTTAFLESEDDSALESKLEEIGERLAASREEGLEEERIAATVAADDPAARLEREFARLSIPDRLRLGLGTVHCKFAPGVDQRRRAIGLHLAEALEVLEHGPTVERDGSDPVLGPLVRVTGVTARGRAVVIRAQAERLPMAVVALEGDQEAPLPKEAA